MCVGLACRSVSPTRDEKASDMSRKGIGEYPDGWPEHARKLSIGHFFLPTILDIRTRFSLPPLIFIASMAQPFAKWLAQPSTVFARFRRLLFLSIAMRQKLAHSAINDHVAATTEKRYVARLIVSCVRVLMVTFRRNVTTSFAVAKRISPLRSTSFGYGTGFVPLPSWVFYAAKHAKLSSIFTIWARRPMSALVSIAVIAKSLTQWLVGHKAILACVHCFIIHPTVSYSN